MDFFCTLQIWDLYRRDRAAGELQEREEWLVLLFLLSFFLDLLVRHLGIGVCIIDGLGRVSQKKRIVLETGIYRFGEAMMAWKI